MGKVSIGVVGSGVVGKVLAAGYAAKGHPVTLGTRTPGKVEAPGAGVVVGDFAAAAAADVIVLAVAGHAAHDALALAGAERLAGKVVLDATNPIAGPPKNGVIPYFTSQGEGLMSRLQAAFPAVRFVKAFNSVGNAFMIDPKIPGGRGTMFICGNDGDAKATTAALLDEVGWDACDVGGVEASAAVEALCQLWCAPGFLRNEWSHAFRLVKI